MSITSQAHNTVRNAAALTSVKPVATATVAPRPLSDMSDSMRVLVLTMRRLKFGRLEQLTIRGGQPVYDPPPTLIRVSRIGGAAVDSDLAVDACDWALTAHVIELVEEFRRIGDGIVHRLEFRNGLPVLIEAPLPAQSATQHVP